MFLTSGIKPTSYVTSTPEVPQSFNGTVYGIIEYVKKIDVSTSQVKIFNNSNVFSISNSSTAGTKINLPALNS